MFKTITPIDNPDFPDHQLVDLMVSPDLRNRKLGEQLGRQHRGWKKPDWATPMLGAFNLELNPIGAVPSISLTLQLDSDKIKYIVRFIPYKVRGGGGYYVRVRRIWRCKGCIVRDYGWKWAQCNVYEYGSRNEPPTPDSESIARAIEHDWVGFWNANFRIKKCCFR